MCVYHVQTIFLFIRVIDAGHSDKRVQSLIYIHCEILNETRHLGIKTKKEIKKTRTTTKNYDKSF